MKIAALLLAAGASTRMGELKQTLPVDGLPMARLTASRFRSISVDKLIVVTGYQHELVKETLRGIDAEVCHNPGWENGIGSSLRCGVKWIEDHLPQIDGILIALADQPLVPDDHFQKLIDRANGLSDIIASHYQDKPAVPVVFGRDYFGDLQSIGDAAGAAVVLRNHAERVISVDLPEYHDIDTPADYAKLSQ